MNVIPNNPVIHIRSHIPYPERTELQPRPLLADFIATADIAPIFAFVTQFARC